MAVPLERSRPMLDVFMGLGRQFPLIGCQRHTCECWEVILMDTRYIRLVLPRG